MADKKNVNNARATKSSNKDFIPWANARKSRSKSNSTVSGKTTFNSSNQTTARKTREKSTAGKNVDKVILKEIKKKTNLPLVISIIVFLCVGAVLGYFTIAFVTRNDKFEMNTYLNNETDIYINDENGINEYNEIGAKCVVFGKDISRDIKITYKYREDISHEAVDVSNVDTSKEGVYYAIYTINHPRYKSVTLIRSIFVLNKEE